MDDEIAKVTPKLKAIILRKERNSVSITSTNCRHYNEGSSPRNAGGFGAQIRPNHKFGESSTGKNVTYNRFVKNDVPNLFMQRSNFKNRYSKNFASTNTNRNKTVFQMNDGKKKEVDTSMNRNQPVLCIKDYDKNPASGNMNKAVFPMKNVDRKLSSIKTNRNNTMYPMKDGKKLTTISSLKMLLEKDETEVLFMLIMDGSGFKYILSKDKLEREMMTVILNLLGKACGASHQNLLRSLIHDVLNNQYFLLQMQHYLLYFHKNIPNSNEVSSFQNIIELLKKFQQIELSNSIDAVLLLLPLLQLTCDIIKSKGISTAALQESLLQIEKEKDLFLDQYKVGKKCSSENESQQNQPPENFRSLSILPTVSDLQERRAFLRPNIVQGKYADVEHYLDVQFRLLREDYVRPLRIGIQQYLCLSFASKLVRPNLKTLQDVRVYYDFQLLYPCLDGSGLVYMASFDPRPFHNFNWENSKRLLTGSLICFSDNNFETIYLASVTNRDPQLLRQGNLLIKFESISSDILKFESLRYFVMVETQAYFEAYRHNLGALRDMNEGNFPLQKYIVKTEKLVEAPSYLKANTLYDMTPLMNYLPSCLKGIRLYDTTPSVCSKIIPILNYKLWPSGDEFGLDKSQYAALKSALTKEISIIQGPPGTGKTFIGLKIAEILLCNKIKNLRETPILVVCYTNHALDQFLEGILKYSKSVGRVGGSCSNKELAEYQLSNLRLKQRKLRCIPHHVRRNIAEKCQILHMMTEKIEFRSKIFHACFSSILNDCSLTKFMNPHHYASLIYKYIGNTAVGGKVLMHWLEVTESSRKCHETCIAEDMQKGNKGESNVDDKPVECISFQRKGAFNVIEVNESDVAEIEAIRNIDDYDDLINVNFKKNAIVEHSTSRNELAEGEWKLHIGKKKKDYVRKKLKSTKAMMPNQVNAIMDVWDLSLDERWSLYMYWVQCYMKYLNDEMEFDQKILFDTHAKLQEIRNEENVFVLRKCDVVGMTTTGAAKYRDILKRLNPQIVIFEEAAEVLEAHVVTSLTKDTEHIIMIGDHQQLRPNPTVYELAKRFHFDVSLFERMIKNGIEYHQLAIQHRMRPCIASLLTPHIYSDLINHESVTCYENIKGVDSNLYFINHSYFESPENELKSHANEHEATYIVELCQYLILQGYDTSQITVLTTYNGQLIKLKQLLKLKNLTGVRATVVDNFQGEENDIILISFVRSNEDGSIGFLKVANRVCVALSRAKKGLYCVGNFCFLSENCDLWKKILTKLEAQNCIGQSLKLCCQIHPETTVCASSWLDFKKVPDGGCLIPCGKILSCGHICARKCHPADLDHKEYKCKEKCQKILCENNHECPNYCYEECEPCKVPISKIVSGCGHEIIVPCFEDGEKCTLQCEKKHPCGHLCVNKCGYPCAKFCEQTVVVDSPCGHSVNIECFKKSVLKEIHKACKIPCNAKLICGHICNGKCGDCLIFENGSLKENHSPCSAKCKRLLKCGHFCNDICGKSCGSCHFLIMKEYPCGHKKKVKCCVSDESECYEKCVELLSCGHVCSGNCFACKYGATHIPCKNLLKQVMNCGHEVFVNCSQNLPKCKNSCAKLLPCGHKCLEICSNPCSEKCEVVVIQGMPCGHLQSSLCFAAKDTTCTACARKSVRLYEDDIFESSEDDDYFSHNISSEDDICNLYDE